MVALGSDWPPVGDYLSRGQSGEPLRWHQPLDGQHLVKLSLRPFQGCCLCGGCPREAKWTRPWSCPAPQPAALPHCPGPVCSKAGLPGQHQPPSEWGPLARKSPEGPRLRIPCCALQLWPGTGPSQHPIHECALHTHPCICTPVSVSTPCQQQAGSHPDSHGGGTQVCTAGQAGHPDRLSSP